MRAWNFLGKGLRDFFLYSEFSVLLCALALSYSTFTLAHLPPSVPLVALVGAAAFWFYTLERNLTLPPPEHCFSPQKRDWLLDHRPLNGFLLVLSLGVLLALLPQLSALGLGTLAALGLLAAFYSIFRFPRAQAHLSWQGLKRFPWLKPVWIAGVWIALTLWLPLFESAPALDRVRLGWLALVWGGWIFGNSFLFDLRDLKPDRKAGLQTLAGRLGTPKTHRWVWALGLGNLGLAAGYGVWFQESWAALALCSATLGLLAANRYLELRGEAPLGFYLLTDLTLVLPFVFLRLLS